MSRSFPIEALCVTPSLLSLHRQVLLMEIDMPALILIADSPFFVRSDGSLYYEETLNPQFIPKREFTPFETGSALLDELAIIAARILEDAYSPAEIATIDKWSKSPLRAMRREQRKFDMHHANLLRKSGMLN